MASTLTQPGDIPPEAAPYFSAPYFSAGARTPVPDLIARYNESGWQGLGLTRDEAWAFQADLDRVTQAGCAAIRAASVT